VADPRRVRDALARAPARAALVLFARAPKLGRVKTRLARRIGAPAALLLHRALVRDALRFTAAAARASGACPIVAWDGRPPALARPAGMRQGTGHLGLRLRRVVRCLLGQGALRVIVIGSDSPAAPGSAVRRAFLHLARGADVVLGPAEDGGYWLVGVRADRPEIFRGIAWGTRRVLRDTVARARARKARVRFVDVSWDVDRPRDLERLRRALTGPGARRAPHTAAALRLLSRSGWRAGARPSGARRAP
jgi:rSAM/selenodomain-associated transferase 1